MNQIEEIDNLKTQISEVYSLREYLKQSLSEGRIMPRHGFKELNKLDVELSLLDSEFKRLWDYHNNKSS
ncbi:MAG: hypothetical protein KZQ64_02815 [gamma proteobacterium symbiont of Bathyaustriella thionipta]|nr:hypothetical protein [gamma proteobacterium symbiont of Bathyaustriella thionipta]MCU7950314.1 hypothetical protein [gamma proteobacterium symbiont of Bathyaustriella thionipta]MCU7952318.1 hypothetical protein [gamma proteobacterium symbiont of Bathyaustriella thionipta]MCU7956833.1 hypothetical protein [gamma proteobacterium symbiont of Bathyaustriella thionipta]MCU7966600.1 hypothetical protein [gamma proteobacterium symbiont of Bathyaustriella thionipta]